jgi:N-succinyl-L-ornithine transcarbamylase
MLNFVSTHDVANIKSLVQKGIFYKQNPLVDHNIGEGKRMGLLFMNPSLRTRISTQIAAENLGMQTYVLNVGKDNWQLEFEEGAIMDGATVEHIKDAAPILCEYFDLIGLRTFPGLVDKAVDYSEHIIKSLQKYAHKPVVSLESATLHPLQSLADIISIQETFKEKRKPKVVLTWAPHIKPIPQCVANSFAQWVNAWGESDFVITHPEGFELDTVYTDGATIEYDQEKALQDADFVYIKNWSGYQDYGKVMSDASSWMMTQKHLDLTHDAKVMHCLPVRRNVEVSDEILDSPNCITKLQATNRVWAAQAVLSEILKPSI